MTDAIAAGGELASLVGRLRELEAKKEALIEELVAQRPVEMPPRSVVEDRLADWRRMLRGSVATGRAVLDRVLDGRIVFTPVGTAAYEFEAPTRYDRLFSGLVVPKSVWTVETPGAETMRPEDVYYAGEKDTDFGEVFRRAANRKGVTSPTGVALLGLTYKAPRIRWILPLAA